MLEDKKALYAALLARDARFDGRFFVGVSSTGVYCRPICRVKAPKFENCTFFAAAAEAEQAGYRPCLRCRPELAPGSSPMDASTALARAAALSIEENCGDGESLEAVAARFGCTARHLRRVFEAEYHVTPVRWRLTCRLLLAKSLLADTALPVVDIAAASGFGSLRRFNDAFKKYYKMNPSAMRRSAAKARSNGGAITVSLGYRPPYLWDEILRFFAARAIPGVETVRGGAYMRAVRFAGAGADGADACGWFAVSHNPAKNALDVTVSESLLPVLPRLLARVRSMFDLYCEPSEIYAALSTMNGIKPGLCRLGTRLPGCFEFFELAARAVLGQQITVRAAGTLAGRIAGAFGVPVVTGVDGLTRTFPPPEAILSLEGGAERRLGELGVISARAAAMRTIAEKLVKREINLGL
ncbi:MAG TPA: DNA-3-methyladenine glycosylase 2 family protein, partial [Candidatus Caccocola faecipullorum]|nr:DNA-3-methyladenine glycosylase 2 family protein [Candidatus Caccocola faecipullorum]